MRTVLGLLTLLGLLDSAYAQESAQTLMERGTRFYEQKDYANAIINYEAAYKLEPKPGTLFSIAQAHRLAKSCDKAIPLYEKFLASSPKAEHAALAWEHIAECRNQPLPPQAKQPFPHKVSLSIGAVSLALLVAAIGTGATTSGINSRLETECPGRMCTDAALLDEAARGHTLAIATDTLIGIGATGLGVAIILIGIEASRAHKRATAPTTN